MEALDLDATTLSSESKLAEEPILLVLQNSNESRGRLLFSLAELELNLVYSLDSGNQIKRVSAYDVVLWDPRNPTDERTLMIMNVPKEAPKGRAPAAAAPAGGRARTAGGGSAAARPAQGAGAAAKPGPAAATAAAKTGGAAAAKTAAAAAGPAKPGTGGAPAAAAARG